MLRLAFPRLSPPVLVALDAAAIVGFAILGVLSHEHALPVSHLAEDALPLLAGWLAAATTFRLYRRPSPRTLLLTWIVGIPLGVLLRAAILGRLDEPRQLAFLLTTLVFSLLIVVGVRTLATLVARR